MTDTETDPLEIDDGARELRRGWTTGACATAAAKAAFIGLHTQNIPQTITIQLPGGQAPCFDVIETKLDNGTAQAAIIKDAGDDPDVTHGATIRVLITGLDRNQGIRFAAGSGVGTVTKPGLPLAVGEPAINPAPREMIAANIRAAAEEIAAPADVLVTISVDHGEAMAKKTWNPRLGILGGLSILGTTGIVVPYSCSAWIASIHQGIDVARSTNIHHLAGVTGSTSEAAVTRDLKLTAEQIIDMGDFVGGMLKHLRSNPIDRLTIAGGFGKISKLAAGHMDLHSKRSQVDPKFLADIAQQAGIESDIVAKIVQADTASQILIVADKERRRLGDAVASRAREVAADTLRDTTVIDVRIYDRAGAEVGAAE